MVAQEREYLTQEAYRAMERAAFEKSEYVEGQRYPMAGVTKEHNRIRENLSVGIGYFLEDHVCQSFSSDFRVHIPKNSLYAYPDLIEVCGELALLDDEFDTLLNPVILIEILSRSTRGYDKNAKFALYRAIPTLREYVLVDSRCVNVEVWQKSAEGVWSLATETAQPDAVIYLDRINLALPIRKIYNRVPDLVGQ